MFGRGTTSPRILQLRRKIDPRVLFIAIAVLVLVLLVTVQLKNGLTSGSHEVWAFRANGKPKTVSLPFLEDPAGLTIVMTMLLAPVFCMSQVTSIRTFTNDYACNVEAEIISQLGTLKLQEIKTAITDANAKFSKIGSRPSAILSFFAATSAAILLYTWIAAQGVLSTWNPSKLDRHAWRTAVYHGWWMNFDLHPLAGIVMTAIATYFLFNLSKQLRMGVVFVKYLRTANRAGFAVAPNLRVNSDGHHGLRPLRYFIQWTYASTISDFVLTLSVFMVWLPFGVSTLYIEAIVIICDVVFAIYPSYVAINGIVREKIRFVESLWNNGNAPPEILARIETVWQMSHLPFRLRSAFSAATLYIVIPASLATFSVLIGNK